MLAPLVDAHRFFDEVLAAVNDLEVYGVNHCTRLEEHRGIFTLEGLAHQGMQSDRLAVFVRRITERGTAVFPAADFIPFGQVGR